MQLEKIYAQAYEEWADSPSSLVQRLRDIRAQKLQRARA
jgi:hypothetical protein